MLGKWAEGCRCQEIEQTDSDVAGMKLDALMVVIKRRMLTRLQVILEKVDSPLHDVLVRYRSSFTIFFSLCFLFTFMMMHQILIIYCFAISTISSRMWFWIGKNEPFSQQDKISFQDTSKQQRVVEWDVAGSPELWRLLCWSLTSNFNVPFCISSIICICLGKKFVMHNCEKCYINTIYLLAYLHMETLAALIHFGCWWT